MPAIQNVERRGAVYYWRRTLRFPDGNAPTVRLSLRTTDQSVARRLACAMTTGSETLRMKVENEARASGLTAEQKTDIFRRAMANLRDELDRNHIDFQRTDPDEASDMIASLVEIYERMLGDFIRHGVPPHAGTREYVEARFPDLSEEQRDGIFGMFRMTPNPVEGTLAVARTEVERVGGGEGPTAIAVARKAIFEGKLAAAREFRQRLDDPISFYGHMPSASPPAAMSAHAPTPEVGVQAVPSEFAGLGPVAAAEKFIADNPKIMGDVDGKRKARWTDKTRSQFLTAARLLQKSYGDRPLHLLTHADVLALNAHFARLPTSHHKSPRHIPLTLEEICVEAEAAVAAGTMPRETIGLITATTNRHFLFLRELAQWVRKAVPSMAEIDWSAFIFEDDRDAREQREAYTVEQGRALFRLPIWTGCRSAEYRLSPGARIWHDAGYWLLLIAWYSGMRRQEMCQLRLDDVRCDDGIWYFNVRNFEQNRLKNRAAIRRVPLADELLRLGLVGYVQALQKKRETMLFPELQGAGSRQTQGDAFYKQWWMKIAEHLDFIKPGQSVHSIRHTVATELKEQRVFEEERADLLGHAITSETGGRYSKAASLHRLQEVVNLIPVVTDRLDPHPVTILPADLRKPRGIRSRFEPRVRQDP